MKLHKVVFTDSEELAEHLYKLGEERRLHFARFCWVRRNKLAPSGKTWSQVFANKEGLTLDQYAAKRKEMESETSVG